MQNFPGMKKPGIMFIFENSNFYPTDTPTAETQ